MIQVEYNWIVLSIRNFPKSQSLPNKILPGAQCTTLTKAEMFGFTLLTLKLMSLKEPFFLLKIKKKDFLKLWTSSYLQVFVFNSHLIESSPLIIFGSGLLHVHKVTSDRSPSRVDWRLPLKNQGGFPDFTVLETMWWSWERERPMHKIHNVDKKI